ncbi:EAL domain-containing protein [Aromatoleum bremense]|uniref:EAL domain-containing protein n=1 Tax=Aromatoleum bremense TaxID=76115 RepID=A0ABX1NS59_9RHOO|nr:EAL domain-containing protein [Aromatoleum bremense]NMG14738.1 EAL domain-containing protein [Aromatoleum bremense]QTQ30989.1 Diguanylate cyclase/phosphodiesterase, PAS domain-containing [Aromatoleum bremense]
MAAVAPDAAPASRDDDGRMGLRRVNLVVGAVFAAAMALGGTLIYQADASRMDDRRAIALDRTVDHAHAIEALVERALSATHALAALVRQGRGVVDDFPGVAAGMLPVYKGISGLVLAPDGVVAQIFPLGGNERVAGIDILGDPLRRPEAMAALELRRPVLAGPLPLSRGASGFIGRLPVFFGSGADERFWGFVTVALPLDGLLGAAHLGQMGEAGYAYELVRIDPAGSEPAILARYAKAPLVDPVVRELEIGSGKWVLRVAPVDGWRSWLRTLLEGLLVLLASGLVAYQANILLRQPLTLRREVGRRTRELAEANHSLETKIAERGRAQDALRRLNRVLRVLSQGNGALVRAEDEAALLGDVCRILVDSGGYRVVWAGLLDADEAAMRAATIVPADALDAARLAWSGADAEGSQGFVGRAITERRPVLCSNLRDDALYRSVADGLAQCDCHTGLALPLTLNAQVFGVLVLHAHAYEVFDADEIAVLEELACDLGYGIANLRTRHAHKEAADRLTESEERFRAISGSAQDAIIMIDAAGRIGYWNPAAERIFGFTAAEAIGQEVHVLLAGEDGGDTARRALTAFRAQGEGPVVGKLLELTARRRDGSAFPVELSVSALQLHGEWHAVGVVRDISYRRESEEALLLRDRAIESSGDGIMISSAELHDYPFTYVNPAFERITGFSAAEAVGHNGRFLLGKDMQQVGLDEIRLALREGRDGRAELRNYRKDGSQFWIELSVSPVRNRVGQVTHFVSVMHEVTERKRYEEELEHLANHDELTGLPNRNLLADRLDQAIAQAARDGSEVAVLAVDLDNFRLVNDGLGHTCADQVLHAMGVRLLSCVREGDTAARMGSDEFVLVLPGVGADEAAYVVQQRIQVETTRPLDVDGQELVVSCSIGISLYPRDGGDRHTLMRNADAAMHAMKAAGRNGFRFFTAEMNRRVDQRLTMERELRQALAGGELLLHYQPQVDLVSGRITGAEALVRWQHPQRGLLTPVEFIPLAEETGLIVPIGEWVLGEACRQNQAWHTAGLAAGRIAVNLSARQLGETDLIALTGRVLAESGMTPARLEFELTESMAMQDVDKVMRVLCELKQLGVRTSLDDFGTGYSSLSYLQRFSVAALKIDRSFVHEVEADPGNAAMVATIIAMAHNLGLKTIAEGVETAAELAWLRAHRCDEIQGYHFSRPLPAAEYALLLREQRTLAPATGGGEEAARTLLLVDDEPNVMAALRRQLRTEGYRILIANSAREGLELLALNTVQVILCDQRMPEMTGTEFFFRVKQLHPDTVRIILSGYTELQSVTDAINQGAIYKFLTKPWDDEALRETVRQAFRMQEYNRRSPGLLSAG